MTGELIWVQYGRRCGMEYTVYEYNVALKHGFM